MKIRNQILLLICSIFLFTLSGCSKEEAGASFIIVLILLAFVAFIIYFVFKALEFVIKAINLYETIIHREEQIIHILFEMKDNKNYSQEEISKLLYNIDHIHKKVIHS